MPSNPAVVAYTWEAQASRSLGSNNKFQDCQKKTLTQKHETILTKKHRQDYQVLKPFILLNVWRDSYLQKYKRNKRNKSFCSFLFNQKMIPSLSILIFFNISCFCLLVRCNFDPVGQQVLKIHFSMHGFAQGFYCLLFTSLLFNFTDFHFYANVTSILEPPF